MLMVSPVAPIEQLEAATNRHTSAFYPSDDILRAQFLILKFSPTFTRIVVLNSGVRIVLTDERDDKRHEFERWRSISGN